MNKEFDVVIIGAGIVGQALALGLAQQSLLVALIDKGAIPVVAAIESSSHDPSDFTSRVSALSVVSQNMLEALGAWQHIQRKQIYTHMEVWDQDGFGHIAFNADEIPQSVFNKTSVQNGSAQAGQCLGHIIENDQINAALYTAIKEQANIQCFFDTHILSMQASDSSAQVVLENGQILQANLLVGADGANSRVREQFAFKQTFWDYDHSAIVANVVTQLPHNNTAKQAFTEFGPLAFLPLAHSHTSSIVFSQQSEQAAALLALPDDEFEQALLVAIDNHYGKVKLVTKRSSFPLRMRYARQWTRAHVALVGDAAHTIHPLAGQGANLGLADAQALLEIVADNPQRFGEATVLRKYERWRKAEAIKVIATMEGFKQLFDGNNPLKKLLRNSGLAAVNKLPLVKQFFIQQASS